MPEETTHDKNVVCRDCRKVFVFAAGEQIYYQERKLAPPKRCLRCREKRKAQGTYGAQVVSVDALRGVVLCKHCRHPASRGVSFRVGEPLCRSCAEKNPEVGDTPEEDRLVYSVWEAWLKMKEKADGLHP